MRGAWRQPRPCAPPWHGTTGQTCGLRPWRARRQPPLPWVGSGRDQPRTKITGCGAGAPSLSSVRPQWLSGSYRGKSEASSWSIRTNSACPSRPLRTVSRAVGVGLGQLWRSTTEGRLALLTPEMTSPATCPALIPGTQSFPPQVQWMCSHPARLSASVIRGVCLPILPGSRKKG